MGPCREFCYSLKAWRNVGPYFRQLRNAVLSRHRFAVIEAEMDRRLATPSYRDRVVDFRLFVDGDFRDVGDVAQWQRVIAARPMLAAYSYSKSWAELVAFDARGEWAPNYRLRLSSGSRHSEHSGIARAVRALPCVGGPFVAAGKKPRDVAYNTAQYRSILREAMAAQGIERYFACPGQCGDCTPRGHACGSDRFKGVTIGILGH
jgi:hypothetical protein